MTEKEDKPRHSVGMLILLVFDLLLAVGACLQLAFVVPVFAEMYRDFGVQPPAGTQILLNISNAIMAFHGIGLTCLVCLVVGLIIWMYLTLHRQRKVKALLLSLWIIMTVVVVLAGIITVTMFTPGGGMHSTIEEPETESNKGPERIR